MRVCIFVCVVVVVVVVVVVFFDCMCDSVFGVCVCTIPPVEDIEDFSLQLSRCE